MVESVDLHLEFDRAGGFPGRALEAALRESIRTGRLAAGSRLPGTRSLADDLGLARGTVVQVYAQLVAEGWLVAAAGSATRVAELPRAPEREHSTAPPGPGAASPGAASPGATSPGVARPFAARPGAADPARSGARTSPRGEQRPVPSVELRPGVPDLGSFPRTAWVAALRRALATAPSNQFDYAEPTGLPVLREAVAGYLARTRGVRVEPQAVVITPGFTGGLALLGRVLRRRGVRVIGTEDPGLVRHRDVLRASGLEVTPLSVGPGGAEPGDARHGAARHSAARHSAARHDAAKHDAARHDAAEPADAGAALLTPAHQHPTGVVLAPDNRARFIDWARQSGAWLIEDDYDGEFRYDQRPVGAMQALAPERIVYAGSTSKSLAPGVRLGWLVVPAPLRRDLAAVIAEAGAAVSALDQLAMADLIVRGDYDRHIRRQRLAYRRRRSELAAKVGRPLRGIAAGMHALLPLGSAAEERELIAEGRRRGLALTGLHANHYWHDPRDRPGALIIGYAAPPAHAWPRALELLARLVQ